MIFFQCRIRMRGVGIFYHIGVNYLLLKRESAALLRRSVILTHPLQPVVWEVHLPNQVNCDFKPVGNISS